MDTSVRSAWRLTQRQPGPGWHSPSQACKKGPHPDKGAPLLIQTGMLAGALLDTPWLIFGCCPSVPPGLSLLGSSHSAQWLSGCTFPVSVRELWQMWLWGSGSVVDVAEQGSWLGSMLLQDFSSPGASAAGPCAGLAEPVVVALSSSCPAGSCLAWAIFSCWEAV